VFLKRGQFGLVHDHSKVVPFQIVIREMVHNPVVVGPTGKLVLFPGRWKHRHTAKRGALAARATRVGPDEATVSDQSCSDQSTGRTASDRVDSPMGWAQLSHSRRSTRSYLEDEAAMLFVPAQRFQVARALAKTPKSGLHMRHEHADRLDDTNRKGDGL
jgi:hypothetical protein